MKEYLSLPESKDNGGWVYFLLDTSLMLTKIGCTSSMKDRWDCIRPYNLSLVIMFFIRANGASLTKWNYVLMEESFHRDFEDRNIAWEWFYLGYEDYVEILERTKVTKNFITTITMEKLKVAFDENLTSIETYQKLAGMPIQEFAVNVSFDWDMKGRS